MKLSKNKYLKYLITFLFSLVDNDKALVIRIFRGASWIIFGTVLSKLLLLIGSICVARILGQSVYGELGLLRSTMSSFAMFASMGLGITATKFIGENLQIDKFNIGGIIAFTLRMAIVFSLIISILLIIYSERILLMIEAPHLKSELIISSIVLFFIAMNGALIGVLAGFEKFRIIAIGALIGAFLGVIVQVLGAYFFGLTGALLGLGTNYLIMFIYYNLKLNQLTKALKIKVEFHHIRKYKDIFLKISLPAALGGLLVSPIFWLCNIIVVKQPGGFEQMAILDVSMQWQQIVLFIPTSLSQLLLPILSSFSNDKVKFKNSFNLNLVINIFITITLLIFILIFSENILNLYGDNFSKWSFILFLICSVSLPIIVSGLIGKSLIAKSKVWVSFVFNLIWGMILLVLTHFLVNILKQGVLGYVYAFCISYLIHFIFNFIYYKYKLHDT